MKGDSPCVCFKIGMLGMDLVTLVLCTGKKPNSNCLPCMNPMGQRGNGETKNQTKGQRKGHPTQWLAASNLAVQ